MATDRGIKDISGWYSQAGSQAEACKPELQHNFYKYGLSEKKRKKEKQRK